MWAVIDMMGASTADGSGLVRHRRAWVGRTFATRASADRFVMSLPRHLRRGAAVVQVARNA